MLKSIALAAIAAARRITATGIITRTGWQEPRRPR